MYKSQAAANWQRYMEFPFQLMAGHALCAHYIDSFSFVVYLQRPFRSVWIWKWQKGSRETVLDSLRSSHKAPQGREIDLRLSFSPFFLEKAEGSENRLFSQNWWFFFFFWILNEGTRNGSVLDPYPPHLSRIWNPNFTLYIVSSFSEIRDFFWAIRHINLKKGRSGSELRKYRERI